MQMVVNYMQSRDYRWKASGPAGEVPQALANTSGLPGEWLPTSTSKGACMALSVYWIIQNANEEDFWGWLGPPATACRQRAFAQSLIMTPTHGPSKDTPTTIHLAKAGQVVADVQNLMRRQRKVLADGDSLGSVEKLILVNDVVTGETSLSRVMDMDMYGDIVDKDTHFRPGYYYFSINSDRQDFHHGVAAHVVDQDNVRFFDPNFGEGDQLKISELFTFIDQLVHVDYRLERGRWTKVEYIHFE
jgi:hypothetical protein